MIKKTSLRKAIIGILGSTALLGASTQAHAWTSSAIGSGVYDGGAAQSVTTTTPFKSWSDYNATGAFHNMSWAHTSKWYRIQIGSSTQISNGDTLDVQFKVNGTNTNAAQNNASKWTGFTIWTSGTNPLTDAGGGTAHAYVQTLGPGAGPSNANIPSASGIPNGIIDYPNYGLNDNGSGSCEVNGGSCANILLGQSGWVGYGNTGLGFDWGYQDSDGNFQTGDHVSGQASGELGGAFNSDAGSAITGTGSWVDNSQSEQIALNLFGLKAGYYLLNLGGVCPDRDPSCLTGGAPTNPTTGSYAGVGGNVRGFTLTVGAAEVSQVPVPAAIWLFGSGLVGLVGIQRRKSQVV